MDLQIHGAVYDINSGAMMWLGQHPNLEKIVGIELPFYRWQMQPTIPSRPGVEAEGSLAAPMLLKLRQGNQRFIRGEVHASTATELHDPFAIVLAGAEVRVPIERIFDCGPGDLVVQQCMGAIAGHPSGTLFASMEYAVVHFKPKLLLVLGESDSAIIAKALEHASGVETTSFGPTHIILEPVAVSAVRAMEQVSTYGGSLTAAGREMRIRKMAVELNALHTSEQLIRHSSVIRDAIRRHELEVHMGILNEATGEVNFIGIHPMQKQLLRDPSEILAAAPNPSLQCGTPGHCDIEEDVHVHGPNCGHVHE